MASVFSAEWPAPVSVKTLITTRIGGVSQAPFDQNNMAHHVGDDIDSVSQNRKNLVEQNALPSQPMWLNQTHSIDVVDLDTFTNQQSSNNQQATNNQNYKVEPISADGSFTSKDGIICSVMTADCLPILLCNRAGTWISAVHAGWRGLADGILEKAVEYYTGSSKELIAWLGPAISQKHFQVGEEVMRTFLLNHSEAEKAFKPNLDSNSNKYWADLYLLAKQRLSKYGVKAYGGGFCTYAETERFYSYRRDGVTGRMASLIWLENH